MSRRPSKREILNRIDDDRVQEALEHAFGDDGTTVNITHCPAGSIDPDADDGLDGEYIKVPRPSAAADNDADASNSTNGVETNLYSAVPLDDDGQPILDHVVDPTVRDRARQIARERAQDAADDGGDQP